MRIHIYRNNPRESTFRRSWGIGHLPERQTLVWAGPLFIRITR